MPVYRRFVLALSVMMLAACAASNIGADYVPDRSPGRGVAAGTITYEGGYGAYRLFLESMADHKSYEVAHGSSQTLNLVLAFKGESVHPGLNKRGSPFAVELPAGRYVLKAWQISQGGANVWSTAPTQVEFEVVAGKTIYLGNFHFRETARMGRAVTAAKLALSDQAERDLPALRSAFPVLSKMELQQALAAGTLIENVGGASDGRITVPLFVPVAK